MRNCSLVYLYTDEEGLQIFQCEWDEIKWNSTIVITFKKFSSSTHLKPFIHIYIYTYIEYIQKTV